MPGGRSGTTRYRASAELFHTRMGTAAGRLSPISASTARSDGASRIGQQPLPARRIGRERNVVMAEC